MMIVFIISFMISMWKIYVFLPNQQLPDDDTTPEAQEKLMKIVLKYFHKDDKMIDTKNLLEKIKNDENFDKKHFWRFNQNKLNQILNKLKLK